MIPLRSARKRMSSVALGITLGLAASPAARAAESVIEFYNATLNHYFITISAAEANGIDQGAAGPGWHRTARVFGAYADAATAPAGALPVCRFYGNVAAGGPNSHFYTADPDECAAGKRDSGWQYEGIAFYVRVPAGGVCPAGTDAIRRNYNRRFLQHDSNHRYTAERDLHDEMAAIGWAAEGIVLCADSSIATPPRNGPVVASGPSTFGANCERRAPTSSVLYPGSEVEPYVSVNPRAPDNLIGVWQQDRWNNGGARGLVAGASFDGGRTWHKTAAPFSRCTGGNAANGGDYWRASDPWVSFSPDGKAFQIGIAFGGGASETPGVNGVAVSRSRDGGLTWDPPVPIIQDPGPFFNDKETVTADPGDSRYAYAIWDRIDAEEFGQTWFSRTTDGGDTWEPARIIHDPGQHHSTLNNQVVVLPDGALVAFFTEFAATANGLSASLGVVRSTDKGVTWSPRILIVELSSLGTRDPETGQRIRDGSGLGHIAADRQGRLHVVFQDARATGEHDSVMLTTSSDGGSTWSNPVRINAAPSAPAFEPAIAIARDGTIGVTYYDFRNNTADPSTLLTDYWLVRSSDGLNWVETHIDGPFDLSLAPDANGLFLGDYQGISTIGNAFVAFYARTNANAPANRTDVASIVIPAVLQDPNEERPASFRASPAVGSKKADEDWIQGTRENLAATLSARVSHR